MRSTSDPDSPACSLVAPQDARFESFRAPETPPAEATLIYDGDCGFCARTARHLRWLVGPRLEVLPSQAAAERFPRIAASEFERAVQLVDARGERSSGARATFEALALAGGLWRLPRAVLRATPRGARVAERAYAWVADHRPLVSRWTRRLAGPPPSLRGTRLTRRVFEAALGLVALVAFASLWVQLDGLIGPRGLAPAERFLERVRAELPEAFDRLRDVPTLAWLSASRGMLHALCAVGVALSLLAILGRFVRQALFGAWAAYLSLATVASPFLDFQWDTLLLETLFVGALWASPRARSYAKDGPEPASWPRLLLRLLLVRLMVGSAVVKLVGGDPAWGFDELTALRWHYETQPLPNPLSWYAHQLPLAMHRASAGVMYFAELALPLLALGPRRVRALACGGLLLFLAAIAATGNYGFFLPLSAVLCLPALDDGVFARFAPSRLREQLPVLRVPRAPLGAVRGIPVAMLATFLAFAGVSASFARAFPERSTALRGMLRTLGPWRTVNGYGLFQRMTRERPEVLIEATVDGEHWEECVLPWKPGPVDRRPAQVAPYMPRLDWQLWFVALGNGAHDEWFRERLIDGVLDGEPAILSLFETLPFEQRPQAVRARLVRDSFTTPQERARTGATWHREPVGTLVPPRSRR